MPLLRLTDRSTKFGAVPVLAVAIAALGCAAEAPPGPAAGTDAAAPAQASPLAAPAIVASNAFYYYADVDAAWRFYSDVLGFETAADYGFAKIMRVAPASYLTLVAAAEGMHTADEPKTATLAIVTDEVEEWFEYLAGADVPMRGELGEVDSAAPHVGFVAVDPEGYFLEFERFQQHPENEQLLPALEAIQPLYPGAGATTSRPAELGVRATVQWLYFRDTGATNEFYERVLGTPPIVDQGWAWAFPLSSTGFLGVVDGARGLHQATEDKGVTMSFIVADIEAWYDYMRGIDEFTWRSDAIGDESGRVRVFVGYDPEGYYLEWDEFLDLEGNEDLVGQLGTR
jgi:catechol 2,3-dioxygenase-like lactoylglutathione lyase family enzyme